MSHEELNQNVNEISLTGNSAVVPLDKPLLSLDESRVKNKINAAVVAEIELPEANASGVPKVLSLLDFGEDMASAKALYWLPEIGDTSHIGVSKHRFGLIPSNFKPETHLSGFFELPLGTSTSFGRDPNSHASYIVGLADDVHEPDNPKRLLSKSHFTIDVSENGEVAVSDHSENYTKLRVGNGPESDRQISTALSDEATKALGAAATPKNL